MKKIHAFSFLFFTLSFLITACHCKKNASKDAAATAEVKRDFEKEGYVKATVINFTVDGCSFMLKLADDKKLEPTNLAAEFKKDQLDVWIKYALNKKAVSVCMAGPMVELSDIQIRK